MNTKIYKWYSYQLPCMFLSNILWNLKTREMLDKSIHTHILILSFTVSYQYTDLFIKCYRVQNACLPCTQPAHTSGKTIQELSVYWFSDTIYTSKYHFKEQDKMCLPYFWLNLNYDVYVQLCSAMVLYILHHIALCSLLPKFHSV